MNVQPTDDELMASTARGEESAFRLLVQRWERPVHAFLWRMTGDDEEARDLAQDVFVKVHDHADRYDGQGKFQSWLFRIAGNRVRSWARRRKLVGWVRFDAVSHDRSDDAPQPDAAVQQHETRDRIRSAIAKLPDRQREALVLKRFQEMSQKEIAESMNTTEGAVESLLVRAMTTLRGLLGREREEMA